LLALEFGEESVLDDFETLFVFVVCLDFGHLFHYLTKLFNIRVGLLGFSETIIARNLAERGVLSSGGSESLFGGCH